MAHARARMAALIITAGLALAGCSSDGDDTKPAAAQTPSAQQSAVNSPAATTGPPPVPTSPLPATSRPSNCESPDVSMQVWVTLCGGDINNKPGDTPGPSGPMQLGQAAETSGDTNFGTSGGTLELTPTTVVYHTGGSPNGSPHVTITVKARNTGAVVAEPTDGTTGRGFEYISSEGEQLNTKVGLIPSGFDGNSSEVQAGTFQWQAYTWGVKENQRGGTLLYTDGTGVQYRWQIPAADTGPQVAEVHDGF